MKKKRPVYNPNDIDESGEKKILEKYDEEIDGKESKNRSRFTLDGQGSTTEARAGLDGFAIKPKTMVLSLDTLSEHLSILSSSGQVQ